MSTENSGQMPILRPNTKVMVLDSDRNQWKVWDIFPGRYSSEVAENEHTEILIEALSKRGHEFWNDWRRANPSIQPNLAGIEFAVGQHPSRGPVGVNLAGYDLSGAILTLCSLAFANLTGAKLSGAKLRQVLINQSTMIKADLSGADLTQASMSALECTDSDFSGADLTRALLFKSTMFACNFDRADLERAAFDAALLDGSTFRKAKLVNAQFGASSLVGCDLREADLSGAHILKTSLDNANLTGARVYGVNCWDAGISAETIQRELIISPRKSEATITVDDIRLAQFVHLLTTNETLRTILDTIGRKAVLILGRFGGGGLDVLHALGACLRMSGYLPMIFEFARPENRTYTETVRTLAGLARFVVVDLSGPSIPQELFATVPNLKIPFVPILEKGRHPYSMFVDLLEYEWVLRPTLEFESVAQLVEDAPAKIIAPAEKRIEHRHAQLKELFRQ